MMYNGCVRLTNRNLEVHERMDGRKIKIEIESTMQKTFECRIMTKRKVHSKMVKLETEYLLEYGTCLRIESIGSNGCVYVTYRKDKDNPPGKTLYNPLNVHFAEWDKKVSFDAPCHPVDAICQLYVTFELSELKKKSLGHIDACVYDSSTLGYKIDYGSGNISYAETLSDAITEVETEAHRTIVPRYQNDIVIKDPSGDIVAVLPWIGIQCDDPGYWSPPSKIWPPMYGDWIRKDKT